MIVRPFLATMAVLLTMAVVSCQNGGPVTTNQSSGTGDTTTGGGGSGGQGGSESTATATSSTASGTGGANEDNTVGDFACKGKAAPIAPIIGDTVDGMGQSIDENGAIALLRMTPPSYPFVATSWTYRLTSAGICGAVDHVAVNFRGLTNNDAPPTMPVNAQVAFTKASDIKFLGGLAMITVPILPPVVLTAGQVLWVGVKLTGIVTNRGCVIACDGGGPDPDSYYSKLNAQAKVDDCPGDACNFAPLFVSPDAATAMQYGNDNRRFQYELTGHAGP